ncbi:DinB family protein [Paraflavitalea pollutisoli]|uniref:DinB family protein n=1 Tax=Paraflavitalea pollutisoli TaxID=3034143 RepID=UPI0023EC94B2|nr:DinB family protein [Paraflavitalea sp. H1-2-19X]
MNTAIQQISNHLTEILEGNPWYGRSAYAVLEEIDPTLVYVNPDEKGHAMIELLYHMITWARFVQSRLEGDLEKDMNYYEVFDWREIDPTVHTWRNGIQEFKSANKRILELLQTRKDDILEEPVALRTYNVGFMLKGYLEHNIYHLAQIIYVKKLLQ